ncbi:MAG: hypothetical protein ACLP19_05245 [Xanthobacteraceae bacterium]
MTQHVPDEPFRPARPPEEWMAELKKRYSAIQPVRAAQREAAERERLRENKLRLQILRAFK